MYTDHNTFGWLTLAALGGLQIGQSFKVLPQALVLRTIGVYQDFSSGRNPPKQSLSTVVVSRTCITSRVTKSIGIALDHSFNRGACIDRDSTSNPRKLANASVDVSAPTDIFQQNLNSTCIQHWLSNLRFELESIPFNLNSEILYTRLLGEYVRSVSEVAQNAATRLLIGQHRSENVSQFLDIGVLLSNNLLGSCELQDLTLV